MKQVIRKAFIDVEKEESWLNSMASMGLALVDYSWCRYVFEKAEPNEHIYRIELLENHQSHAESISYIQFLEDNGIECVATYTRWLYLRKKACDGPFDLYTDAASRHRYYKRLGMFYNSIFTLEFTVGVINLGIGVVTGYPINLFYAFLCLTLAFIFARIGAPVKTKIRKYEQEKIIRE